MTIYLHGDDSSSLIAFDKCRYTRHFQCVESTILWMGEIEAILSIEIDSLSSLSKPSASICGCPRLDHRHSVSKVW